MKVSILKEHILELFEENGNQTMSSNEIYEKLLEKDLKVARNTFNNTLSQMVKGYRLYRVKQGHYYAIT